jgi:uncharacterized membrane protein YphA (DoxX/SURF4 family)
MNPTGVIVVSSLLTAFFIFASSIKILGWQKKIFETQLEFFEKYGLNRNIMALVGFVELFGAIALWLPGVLGIAGVGALVATSAGAICCHLYFDTWKDAVPAIVTLELSGMLLYTKLVALGTQIV